MSACPCAFVWPWPKLRRHTPSNLQDLSLDSNTATAILYRYFMGKRSDVFSHPGVMEHMRTKSFFSLP